MCKVKWDHYQDDRTTRGSEEESKDEVSQSLSRRLPNLGDEIHLKGGRIVTPQNLSLLKIELKWFICEILCTWKHRKIKIFINLKFIRNVFVAFMPVAPRVSMCRMYVFYTFRRRISISRTRHLMQVIDYGRVNSVFHPCEGFKSSEPYPRDGNIEFGRDKRPIKCRAHLFRGTLTYFLWCAWFLALQDTCFECWWYPRPASKRMVCELQPCGCGKMVTYT